MLVMLNRILSVIVTVAAISIMVVAMPASSIAQTNLSLVKTSNPDDYFDAVLDDIKSEGMSSVRMRFEEMGLNTPQAEATITMFESIEGDKDQRWTKQMGVSQSGEVLRQYYGYAYLGNNGWIFIRIDFYRANDEDWVLASFNFNSEYGIILAPDFGFLE